MRVRMQGAVMSGWGVALVLAIALVAALVGRGGRRSPKLSVVDGRRSRAYTPGVGRHPSLAGQSATGIEEQISRTEATGLL